MNSKGLYTFIIVAYNQEQYIIEALESVRYQIEQYGNGRKYQLIIADDYSEDNTRNLIEHWLLTYENLFSEVTKVYQSHNVGTCRNVAGALQRINGDIFYSIGGDDMFSYVDIFGELECHKDIEILMCPSVIIENGLVRRDWKSYRAMVAQSGYKDRYIDWAIGLGGTFLTGTAWNNRVNTKEVMEFMSGFGLYDDVPRYYAIWKNIRPIRYKYSNKPLMIYRKNAGSVSSLNGTMTSSLNADTVRFYTYVAENSSGFFYKIAARMKGLSMAMRGYPLLNKIGYISPYYFGKLLFEIKTHKKMREEYEKFIADYADDAQGYTEYIHAQSQRLIGDYEDSKV